MVRIKLLQLRAEFGQISKKIDENTYTFTLTSVDFEFLRLHFPHLVEVETIGGMALLPIKSDKRYIRAPSIEYDIVDEALDLFRANCFFRNFEVKGNADRVLIYLILVISDYLSQLLIKNPTQKEAVKFLNNRAVDNELETIPGEVTFPLRVYCSSPANRNEMENIRSYLKNCRQEIANRLIDRVYVDGKLSKWWMSFAKRKFMGLTFKK
ncbi:9769_t:CDS:2 [Entrophospora sp. SA101]|nr:9769_t:CDS:2 [Entrophospora sp. SA101]